ncbi:hypothetical protein GWK47_009434 [Chionoecetes opilio]|uniref:Uncharacterized protein n=1 Tax=Chionoecetes opilio TaxID=41210 RepID=A0A8J4XYR4_CHIOP|nr:hypothetical protein GWK47_009434 [Chionoecetes opilio]
MARLRSLRWLQWWQVRRTQYTSARGDKIVTVKRLWVCTHGVLFNGKPGDNLSAVRYTRLCKKVSAAKSFVTPERLPPPSSATKYPSLRSYLHAWSVPSKNRRKATTQDYLLGGKTISPPAVAISSWAHNPLDLGHRSVFHDALGDTLMFLHAPQYLERRYKSVALRKLIPFGDAVSICFNFGPWSCTRPPWAFTTVTNLSGFASRVSSWAP